ncbi:MAG TPA: hypothetical protein VJ689_09875 [Gaiellaceae bacterium]|nr:hypothetical protein [Gaiellaceae bacterium]
MTVLDFLSPGLADAGALARSPMDRAQRDAGATFAERDGWLVPISLPGEAERLAAAGVADLSHVTKLEVRPAGEAPATGGIWYPISRRRALLLGTAAQAAAARGWLTGRLVVDVTAQHGVIVLVGPEAPAVLRRLTHLHHFPAGGELAHITVHVLERGGGYWIVFPQEYGHYLWEVVVDRAEPFGGGPVGVDALPAEVLA